MVPPYWAHFRLNQKNRLTCTKILPTIQLLTLNHGVPKSALYFK
jgi:hypothetical protein